MILAPHTTGGYSSELSPPTQADTLPILNPPFYLRHWVPISILSLKLVGVLFCLLFCNYTIGTFLNSPNMLSLSCVLLARCAIPHSFQWTLNEAETKTRLTSVSALQLEVRKLHLSDNVR